MVSYYHSVILSQILLISLLYALLLLLHNFNLTIIGIIFFVHSTTGFYFTLSSLSFLSMSVLILIYHLFPSLFSPFFILFSFLFRASPPYSLSLYRKTCLLTVNFSPERNTKPVSKLLQSLPGCLACLSVCLTD